jgi:hypothetical protein
MKPRSVHTDRRGLALPSAMFALVAMGILAAGLFTFADLGTKSVRNRESAVRATHVVEAGANHTLALMRGSLRMQGFSRILKGNDNVAGTADDSLLIDWPGLPAGDQIPAAGQAYLGHTYFVSVHDDAADSDPAPGADNNGRVLIRCRAVTADGATAQVEAVIGAAPMPGIAADGDLGFAGAGVTVKGACGGVHANGNLTATGGGPFIAGTASAMGGVTGNYNSYPSGSPAPRLAGADEVVIPDLNPMDYCVGANFRLLVNGGAPSWQNAAGVTSAGTPPGWTYDDTQKLWNTNGSPLLPNPGTYCVQGNVRVAGSTGSVAVPKPLSILATGSIRVEGQPYLSASHPDGIQLLAGGDIYLAGNTSAGSISYQGMIYAGAQCSAQGSATSNGQMLCANGAQPAGATEWAPANAMTGSFTVNFDCSGNIFNKRRFLFWYPRVGV